MKKFLFILFLGALLGVSISYFILYSEQQEKFNYKILDSLLFALIGALSAFCITKTSNAVNLLLPWQKNAGLRLFVGILFHSISVYFLLFGLLYLYHILFLEVTTFFDKYFTALIKLAIVIAILMLIFEVIYFALYSYYSYSKLQIETVKQERKQIELQLIALKSQLSPHFLFNSLNTISSLLFKNSASAEKFIRRLANMYDFTLKSYHQKLITVEQELEFVKSYNHLLQTRFQNKFSFTIALEKDTLSTKIPPLTLQMLVENAVKHNQIILEKPLKIEITATANTIIVENTITKAPQNITSFNIGLKNINSRYLLLINKSIAVVRGNTFKVEIPIIK